MSKFYGAEHRKLQDEFDTRRLADLMEGGVMHAEFAPHELEFIQSRAMIFLSTLEPAGRPTVSHQGCPPGFSRLLVPREVRLTRFLCTSSLYRPATP